MPKFILLPLLLLAAACTQTSWQPTLMNAPPLNQAMARCQFAVSSSPGSMLNGGVMPSGILMEQCMAAEGYTKIVTFR